MSAIKYLECMTCHTRVPFDSNEYVCMRHSEYGTYNVVYDYEKIKTNISKSELKNRPFAIGIARYKEFLPISDTFNLDEFIKVGGTSLVKMNSNQLIKNKVYIKNDTELPSGSLKDRASYLAILKALELNYKDICVASTGNAASSLSCLCAMAGLNSIVYVPNTIPENKLIQNLVYGAKVNIVNGDYDAAYQFCISEAKKTAYNRCTGYNPFMTEGKKTVAYEIAEQLDWQTPDYVIVSVGDGCILGGVYKGFYDLYSVGWIDKIPKLIGVQADGSSYLYNAYKNNEDIATKAGTPSNTCADSISCQIPKDRYKAVEAIRKSDGFFTLVTDDEILEALYRVATEQGLFVEPSSAASFAAYYKLHDQFETNQSVVIIATGSGLKDIESATRSIDKYSKEQCKWNL